MCDGPGRGCDCGTPPCPLPAPGVDLVLNSLAEEKLQASVRCLAQHGRFLEIGKFDLSNNHPLGEAVGGWVGGGPAGGVPWGPPGRAGGGTQSGEPGPTLPPAQAWPSS